MLQVQYDPSGFMVDKTGDFIFRYGMFKKCSSPIQTYVEVLI